MARAIVDAGPLIALFNRKETHHVWASAKVAELEPPLLLCEPALTEAMYRLQHLPAAQEGLMVALERDAFRISFHAGDHLAALRQLHTKYRDRPISFTDACIVRMAELNDRHAVLTLDSDFAVYRKNGREPLTLISPSMQ